MCGHMRHRHSEQIEYLRRAIIDAHVSTNAEHVLRSIIEGASKAAPLEVIVRIAKLLVQQYEEDQKGPT